MRDGRDVEGDCDGVREGREVVGVLEGVLDVAGADRGLEGPDVRGDGEVVADERDVGLGGGVGFDGVVVGAGGAAEVLENDDGDGAAGGRLQDGFVAEVIVQAGAEDLGGSGGGEEEEQRECSERFQHGFSVGGGLGA